MFIPEFSSGTSAKCLSGHASRVLAMSSLRYPISHDTFSVGLAHAPKGVQPHPPCTFIFADISVQYPILQHIAPKHKEFWRGNPWCVSHLSHGHVPSVPSYVPSVPQTFCPFNWNFRINRPKRPGCPWDVPSFSLGCFRGIPTTIRKEPEGKNAKGENFAEEKMFAEDISLQKISQKIEDITFTGFYSISGYLRNLRGRLLSSEKFSEVFTLWVFTLKPFLDHISASARGPRKTGVRSRGLPAARGWGPVSWSSDRNTTRWDLPLPHTTPSRRQRRM